MINTKSTANRKGASHFYSIIYFMELCLCVSIGLCWLSGWVVLCKSELFLFQDTTLHSERNRTQDIFIHVLCLNNNNQYAYTVTLL